MKTMEADVIVVAVGPAGLAAAITAGENDLKAIVFEKSNTTGWSANMGMDRWVSVQNTRKKHSAISQ